MRRARVLATASLAAAAAGPGSGLLHRRLGWRAFTMASTGLQDSPSTGATATATTNASAGSSLVPGVASSSAATGTRGLSTGGEGLRTEPGTAVPESDKPVLVIVGATGVGKSKLSVDLALRLNGEVVNADAVQMYRGLDIAAAKVSQEEMQGVPHHLMSFLDHTDSYTVKRFRDNALTVINDIHSRGKLPIIVGGTLYYIQNVLWPTLIDGSETDAEADEPIDDRAGVEIPEGMTPHEYLSKIDPVRADTLHPRDTRKIQRSIYVTKTRGRPHSEIIAELQASGVQNKLRFRTAVLWLRCNKNVHEERLDKRVDDMLEAGIVEEAMGFIKEHDLIDKLKANDPCLQDGQFQAIGFKEFLPFLRASEDPNVDARTRDEIKRECLSTLLTHHNQYRKYQTKWIRKRLLTRNAPVYGLETDRCGKHPFAWDRDVVEPSVKVYKWLTSTPDLSNTEPKGMRRENASSEDQTLTTYHCALCNVTSIGKTQHMKHIKGQRHRRREQVCQVPRQNKRPRDERFAELLKEELEREAANTKKDDGVTGPKADSS